MEATPMTLSRTIAKLTLCECTDCGCSHHSGHAMCHDKATDILYRVDMQDETGTAMCDACSDDAFSSGLFTTKEEESDDTDSIRCNQCEASMINGVFCHETGCPNTKSRYDADTDTWIKQVKCFECGSTVDVDTECCTNSDEETI